MRTCKATYLFLALATLLTAGCMKPSDHFLVGAWVSYTPQGIHSPALNVHSFMEDGRYVKTTLICPPSEAMNADAYLSLTAYQAEGVYLLVDKELKLRLEGEETRWHCEIDGDQLYLIDIANEGTNIVLLARIQQEKSLRSAESGK